MLSLLIFVLLFSLSLGVFSTLALNSLQVGRRYFWMHGLSAVTITLVAYLLLARGGLPSPAKSWLSGFLVFGTLFSLVKGSRWEKGSLTLYTVSVTSGVVALSFILAHQPTNPIFPVWIVILNGFLSMELLGFSMAAMLLGHWYLIQPRLSIDELKKISLVLIAFVLVRFLFSSCVLGVTLQNKSEAEIYRYFLSTTPGIFSLMRWAWGLLGTLVLSYFLWGTVKIRSTQSATGILYVMVLGVLTGETLSLYLTLNFGLPL